MIRRTLTTLSVLALASTLFAVGCAGAEEGAGDEEAESSEDDLTAALVVTEDQGGQTLAVTTGQKVTIKIGGNPTTGYQWKVKDSDGLGTAKESYKTASSATGSGGTYSFTFATKGKAGEHDVVLEYKRSWEARAIRTFKVTLSVGAPVPKCATVRCQSGYHCETRGLNGGSPVAVCLRNN